MAFCNFVRLRGLSFVYRPEQLSAAIAAMLKTVAVLSVKADSSNRIFSPPSNRVLMKVTHGGGARKHAGHTRFATAPAAAS